MAPRMGVRVVAVVWILLALAEAAWAAPRTIRGVVVESGSPKPIEGASVLSDRGDIATTDVDGY